MSEHIVGMMWNRNEEDILEDTITAALKQVDTLMIADDGSTDNSWDIIQRLAASNKDQIEHIRRQPDKEDKGQRQALLSLIQERHRAEDTWVQIVESDIMVLETDVKRVVREKSNDVSLKWVLLNAILPPDQSWDEADEYPNWSKPIQEIMTYAHKMELMTYTFRPFKELSYEIKRWRPWPQGFSKVESHTKPILKTVSAYTPILAHYGYRGPTHMKNKYADKVMTRATQKDLNDLFNNHFTLHSFPMSRAGWMNSKGRRGTCNDKVWGEWEDFTGWRRIAHITSPPFLSDLLPARCINPDE